MRKMWLLSNSCELAMGGAHPDACNGGVGWTGTAGTEVGSFLGAREPVCEFDRKPHEHPSLLPGIMDPGARLVEFEAGGFAPAVQKAR